MMIKVFELSLKDGRKETTLLVAWEGNVASLVEHFSEKGYQEVSAKYSHLKRG